MPIRKTKTGKFKIDRVKGTSPTKEHAVKRLKAVKASQARRGKK